MEVAEEKVPIKIIVINDVPYVWDAAEWLTLRRDHRICGIFDGAVHPSVKPLGSMCPSLPLRLTRIEAHYLVNHGIAQAFHIPVLNQGMPQVTRDQVHELREQRRIEQLDAHRNKRRMQIESMVDKIIEGKRRKGRGIVPDRNTVIQEEMLKVQLPYEMTQIDLVDPWVKESDFTPCDLSIMENPLEKLRYRVFEDFHSRRKYFITSGLKFGGDFLAYPDDPCRSHSEFIIVCNDSSRGRKPQYIQAQIRLAITVKKVLLLATFDEARDKVKYKVLNSVNPSKRRQRRLRKMGNISSHQEPVERMEEVTVTNHCNSDGNGTG